MKKRADGRYVKSKIINGKKIYFYSVASTERKAQLDIERQMLEYMGKIEKGKLLKDVIDEFEQKHYKDLSYLTVRRYKSLTKQLNAEMGNDYIKSIKISNLQKYLESKAIGNASQKSLKAHLSILRLIWKYAYTFDYVTENITQYLKLPKGNPKVTRDALTENEINQLASLVEKEPQAKFLYFILYTGLRKGEALALQYKDIDRNNKVICVNKTLYFESVKPIIKQSTKTEAGNREVIIPDKLLSILPKGKGNDYIFGKNGEMITGSQYYLQEKHFKKNTGLNITAHICRHTYATFLFESGINEKDAQVLMGHSDINVTKNIYTHIRDKRKTETAEKLNNFFNSN